MHSPDPPHATSDPKWCCAVELSPSQSALSRAQVEEQCNDPKLMQCGLEKCVASDGSVEWVAAHSKARHLEAPSRATCPQPHSSSP